MSRVVPRLIALLIGGVDRSDEVSKFEVHSNPAESDFTSFLDARSGGAREYTAELTVAEDHDPGSLLSLVLDSSGAQALCVYQPYGASAEVAYELTLIVSEPDGKLMGAEADESPTQVATVDLVWKATGRPMLVGSD